MSKVVFILGAGASRPGGAPLMYDFLEYAKDIYAYGSAPEYKEDFKRVFRSLNALQRASHKAHMDTRNLEAVFTALEMGELLSLDWLEEPKETVSSLKRLISVTLSKSQKMIPNESNDGLRWQAPNPYPQFAELLKELNSSQNNQASVITFNYDLGLDLAALVNNHFINYALPSYKSNRNSGIAPLTLLKLHGSLNWIEDGTNVKVAPLDSVVSGVTNVVIGSDEKSAFQSFPARLSKYAKKEMGFDSDVEPFIVPPTWNKLDYQNPLAPVWAQATKELSEAEYIIVIGYSLPATDGFFRHLYGMGTVGNVELRKFAVFDIQEKGGAVEKRFKSLLSKNAEDVFEYHSEGFKEALSNRTIRGVLGLPKEPPKKPTPAYF